MGQSQTNLERLSKEKFRGSTLEWKISPRIGSSLPYIDDGKFWYFNKRGTDIVYSQSKELGQTKTMCYGCNGFILEKQQSVTEWSDDLGPCTGGDVTTRYVKYCPTCEQEPPDSAVALG